MPSSHGSAPPPPPGPTLCYATLFASQLQLLALPRPPASTLASPSNTLPFYPTAPTRARLAFRDHHLPLLCGLLGPILPAPGGAAATAARPTDPPEDPPPLPTTAEHAAFVARAVGYLKEVQRRALMQASTGTAELKTLGDLWRDVAVRKSDLEDPQGAR